MNQSMGQIAFETCTQYIATHVPDDIPEISNEWGDLPPAYREAWEAGAQAVIVENDRLHSMANKVPGEREREARDLPFNLRSMGLHHPLGEER